MLPPRVDTAGTYDYSSNLILFGQRWYDPATGRFTQQDSLETIGDPGRSNRYEYANSSPTNYVDPTGQDAVGCFTSIATFVGGAATLVGAGLLAATPEPTGLTKAGAWAAGTAGGAALAGGFVGAVDECF